MISGGNLRAANEVKPHVMGIWGTLFLRDVLGVTFITKFLELHEHRAVTEYKKLLPDIPPSHRERFREIIKDEEFHEKSFIGQLKEKRIAYIGFIVLGLADAIVEITGVHAGFLGVTGSTLLAGISGVIVGFAAAISMGSAAYLQAKQDPEEIPVHECPRHRHLISLFRHMPCTSLFPYPHDAHRIHCLNIGRHPPDRGFYVLWRDRL